MERQIYAKSKQIENLYTDGYNCRQIAELLNTKKSTIYNILRKNNIKMRSNSHSKIQYKINENYFDIIDSEEKAYFLGFIYADGHNERSNNSIRIALKSNDYIILEKLNALIQERPITIYKDKEGYERASLNITNKHVSETLEKIGVLQDKTHHCYFPKLDKQFIKHFIRGYFDGDGSIFFTERKNNTKAYRCSFVATKPFLIELKEILVSNNITCHIDKSFYDQSGIVTKLYLCSNKQSVKLFDFLYSESSLYLERKYNKFLEMLAYINNQNARKCKYCDNMVFGNGMCYKHLDQNKIDQNKNYTRSKKIDITILQTMLNDNITQTNIAKYFGVSTSSICKIVKRRKMLSN